MSIEKVTHHYKECGLPDIWIKCLRTKDDAGRKTITIPNIRSLHKLIARKLVMSDGALTGPELKFLRTEMGMTRVQMAELVHREPSTVSRWEREEDKLDGAIEALIRIGASKKLGLDEIDMEEISSKCVYTNRNKESIHIYESDLENSRAGDYAIIESLSATK